MQVSEMNAPVKAHVEARQAEEAEQARLKAVAAEHERLERIVQQNVAMREDTGLHGQRMNIEFREQEAKETIANVTSDLPPIEDGSTQESQDILADGVPIPVSQPPHKQRAYVAGPMRGLPAFGFPAFHAAEADLQARGFEVFSPARRDEAKGFAPSGMAGTEDLSALGFDLRDALATDLDWITRHADMVVVLPGWEASKGANAEVATARALGIPVETLAGEPIGVPVPSAFAKVTGDDEPGWLCKQVAKIVNGGRNRVYGRPEDNFERIAILWGAWECVLDTVPHGSVSASVDVAIRNVLQKLARIAATPDHTDSWRDVAGYADCGARCAGCDPGK